MDIEKLDVRKRAFLNMRAEKHLADSIINRTRILSAHLGAEIPQKTITAYLNRCQEQLRQIDQRLPVLHEMVLDVASQFDKKNRDKGHAKYTTASEDLKGAEPFSAGSGSVENAAEELDFEEFLDETDISFRLRNDISDLRSLALISRSFFDIDPTPDIKRMFLITLACQFEEPELPQTLRALLTDEDMHEIKQDREDSAEQLDQLVRQTHAVWSAEGEETIPDEDQISGSQAWVAKQAEKRSTQITELIKLYPDPRMLIDMVLETKDGKLSF